MESTQDFSREDFVKRIYAEKVELDERLHKLSNFLSTVDYSLLNRVEQFYLRRQENAMWEYSNMLTLRLHTHGLTEVEFYGSPQS